MYSIKYSHDDFRAKTNATNGYLLNKLNQHMTSTIQIYIHMHGRRSIQLRQTKSERAVTTRTRTWRVRYQYIQRLWNILY